MKLYLTFDNPLELDDAVAMATKLQEYVHGFVISSVLLYHYGMRAIEKFKKVMPDTLIIADTKIIEHGSSIARMGIDAGADWVTVMGGTRKAVINTVCQAAQEASKKTMLDLTDSYAKGQTALEAQSMGAHFLYLFMPHQENEKNEPVKFTDMWEMIKGNTKLPIFIGGKINRASLEKIHTLQPAGIIVGKAITEHADPLQETLFFLEALR
ncbi:MAG: orotidine 5'-phosphate decarboxylase / HUMPS family protein [Candidatus Babeliales bacterium]